MIKSILQKSVLIAFIIGMGCNAYAIPCALDTDCQLLDYSDALIISNIEKADYQCYVKQTDLTDIHPIHTFYVENSGKIIMRRNFGGNYAHEGNIYVTANKLFPTWSSDLLVSVERARYDYHYRLKPLSELATITVHCKKI